MATLEFDPIIEAALREDMPEGDITSEGIIPAEARSEATFLAKEDGILAGLEIARRVFEKIDLAVEFTGKIQDGAAF
ncbi:MAG: nicotinate-nucleotide diphosphorylase (carboxylating), partial [Candidatus Aminicenantes bacterium]|nr:nicotinate-nucleotide diphosphorylase (carboxylating) [Candidatus Aminicenantes bacterium]